MPPASLAFRRGPPATNNNIFVSRSTDFGQTWTATLVFHAPLFTRLNNVFPALAVDPTNGHLYATWSDGFKVYFSSSANQGVTWSTAVTVNVAPANTAIFPWIAAYNGVVDLVYYGTTASSNGSGAVWNTYLAQTSNSGASFAQSLVSNTSNHTGVICTRAALVPGARATCWTCLRWPSIRKPGWQASSIRMTRSPRCPPATRCRRSFWPSRVRRAVGPLFAASWLPDGTAACFRLHHLPARSNRCPTRLV